MANIYEVAADLDRKLQEAKAKVERMGVMLLRYGNHELTCTHEAGSHPRPCNCGWDNIREAADTAEEKVDCTDCGACCQGMGVPPYGDDNVQPGEDELDSEYDALPPELKAEIDAAWEAGTESFAGKPCIWFEADTRRCKHYEWRPVVCASFEPGNPVCLEDRKSMFREAAEAARKES